MKNVTTTLAEHVVAWGSIATSVLRKSPKGADQAGESKRLAATADRKATRKNNSVLVGTALAYWC
jgi:hypothetical protein